MTLEELARGLRKIFRFRYLTVEKVRVRNSQDHNPVGWE